MILDTLRRLNAFFGHQGSEGKIMIPLGNASQHLPKSAFVITLFIAARALRFMLECQWDSSPPQ
jgi:hypothetical protein